MKRTLATVFLCLLLAPAAWAHFYEGLAAYKRGDYRPALREFRPLAENGSSTAQTYIGFMYENGQGVSLDYAKAVMWYRKAAEQGNDIAQTNLGNMYLKGLGVAQDYAEAMKWYRKAVARGYANAEVGLSNVVSKNR